MLATQNERLLAFTPDYKINLIAPSEIADGAFGKFRTELRQYRTELVLKIRSHIFRQIV